MALNIETRKERSTTVVRLSGSILTMDGAASLQASLAGRIAEGDHNLLLDVQQVVGMDQAGAETFLQMQTKAKAAGGALKMVGARYPFIATIALYDSSRTFSYYGNTEQALDSFEGEDARGIKHFDILEFVKAQEKELEEQSKPSQDDNR